MLRHMLQLRSAVLQVARGKAWDFEHTEDGLIARFDVQVWVNDTNVALGQSSFVSSTYPAIGETTYVAAKAVDGNNSTQ